MTHFQYIECNTIVVLDGMTSFSLDKPLNKQLSNQDCKIRKFGSNILKRIKFIACEKWLSLFKTEMLETCAALESNPVRSTPYVDKQSNVQSVHWAYWT